MNTFTWYPKISSLVSNNKCPRDDNDYKGKRGPFQRTNIYPEVGRTSEVGKKNKKKKNGTVRRVTGFSPCPNENLDYPTFRKRYFGWFKDFALSHWCSASGPVRFHRNSSSLAFSSLRTTALLQDYIHLITIESSRSHKLTDTHTHTAT